MFGVRALIDLGWITAEQMRTALDGRREVTLSLVDDGHGDEHVQPSGYFDVKSNAWALIGLWDAWREAEAMCQALPVELDDALDERRHQRQLQERRRRSAMSSSLPSDRKRIEERDVELAEWRRNQPRRVPVGVAESTIGPAVSDPVRVGGNLRRPREDVKTSGFRPEALPQILGVEGGVRGGIGGGPAGRVPSNAAGQPVRVGGNISRPTKTRDVQPRYPGVARAARVQGTVILEATIGPTGDVTEVNVLRSVPLLDDAAIAAVRQWQYTPTLLNGVAVPVTMTVTVNFSLR